MAEHDPGLETIAKADTIVALMTSESGQPLGRGSWTLLLGPGSALSDCLPLLEVLAQRRSQERQDGAPLGIQQLESWPALFCEFPEVGRIFADCSSISWKEVGWIEAFCATHSEWELWLCGEDASARVARELLRLEGARWLPRPLDLTSLTEAVRPPRAAKAGSSPVAENPRAAFAGKRPPATPAERAASSTRHEVRPQPSPSERGAPEESDIAARVAEILRGERGPQALSQAGPQALSKAGTPTRVVAPRSQEERLLRSELLSPPLDDLELERDAFEGDSFEGDALEGDACEEHSVAAESLEEDPFELEPFDKRLATEPRQRSVEPEAKSPRRSKPAPYFRHQVADLADLVQCVNMSLEVALETAAEDLESSGGALSLRLDELRSEVARLQQFTRTLSFLAAPPGPGSQTNDLAPLLTEMLSAHRAEPEAPRFLIRTSEPLVVRCDKVLLVQALDALLFLCTWCAGRNGTVRVDGRKVEATFNLDAIEEVLISIRFPAGELGEIEPALLLEPYALRRQLPELGPNALAAASGILRGQGGQLELRKEAGGLEWLIRLPAAH